MYEGFRHRIPARRIAPLLRMRVHESTAAHRACPCKHCSSSCCCCQLCVLWCWWTWHHCICVDWLCWRIGRSLVVCSPARLSWLSISQTDMTALLSGYAPCSTSITRSGATSRHFRPSITVCRTACSHGDKTCERPSFIGCSETWQRVDEVYRLMVWVYLCFYFAWWTYMRHHRQCCIYRVAPKNVSHKVLPISLHRFSNCFHWCILWKICSKVVTKHTTTPYLRRYTTLCKMCKIHQYLVKIWTKVWSLIFWPIMKVKLCFVSDSLSVFKHKKTILSYRMGQKLSSCTLMPYMLVMISW